MANELLTTISRDDVERANYLSRMKAQTDRDSMVFTLREQGELFRAEKMARSLLEAGMDEGFVALHTQLSPVRVSDIHYKMLHS